MGGALLTMLTGLLPIQTLPGGTHYGFPVAWLARRVLAPEYFPWRVLGGRPRGRSTRLDGGLLVRYGSQTP